MINFNAPVVINIHNCDCGDDCSCSDKSSDSEPECPDVDPEKEEVDDIMEEIQGSGCYEMLEVRWKHDDEHLKFLLLDNDISERFDQEFLINRLNDRAE